MSTLLPAGAMLLLFAGSTFATSIEASAGNLLNIPVLTNRGNQTWGAVPPGAASMTWVAGIDNEDGHNNPDPAANFGPDNYFGPGGTPKRPFGSFAETYGDGAHGGSTADNSGSGASFATPKYDANGFFLRNNYNANWAITATGELGTSTGDHNWSSHTEAKDPWSFSASDFLSIPGPDYDLFFMSGINSADISPEGDFGFEVSYQTVAGIYNLLTVTGGIGGVNVSVGTIPGLQIFALSSVDDGPEDLTGAVPLTAGLIQGMFASVADTGVLASPALFGFILNGQPIPTGDMGGGVVASLNADTFVDDSAAGTSSGTPEPTSLVLIAGGLAGMFWRGRRRV